MKNIQTTTINIHRQTFIKTMKNMFFKTYKQNNQKKQTKPQVQNI